MTVLWVALGGALGASLRYTLSSRLDAAPSPRPACGIDPGSAPTPGRGLPWGTLTANVSGSLLVGLLSGLALPAWAAAFAIVGGCGALTTYSSFAVQTLTLGPRRGGLYVALTLVLALGACAAGYALT